MHELNVSLEHHLLEVLNALLTILPDDLAAELSAFISSSSSSSSSTLIPYYILLKISQWSRSPAGLKALQSSSLDPQSYSMVSLLAGTRTSPEKKFPAYVAKDPETERRQAANDKKAVSTVVNGVLSVAGTGFATWWASERAGMRLEWRALFATSVALVVALAEIILYMIWDSRRSTKKTERAPRILSRNEKLVEDSDKADIVDATAASSSADPHHSALRQRLVQSASIPHDTLQE
ncbi:uncharacterized protein BJ212DRAFT_1284281 [Suillus subaureus]|uniref:Uncharacterized protein n=1 Tax=Suillus subaureus TaxID=48587 RepID=A0A9P7DW91_9AGAM|nr:uncharacterized protein BJ212DRAFT_1284281 [Suillus subaureus]KAG1804525.1 hypothetical protein BJ212DRAFT_1284281 [Suillus subaureus]